MRHSVFLSQDQKKQLEYEVVSQELRFYLTRLIERNELFSEEDESFPDRAFINKNWLINRSRNFLELPIYVLEADNWGGYQPSEYAWHFGEWELCLRRLDTPSLIELICEVMERGWLTPNIVNNALKKEGTSFRFTGSIQNRNIGVVVLPIDKLEKEAAPPNEHQNVRILVARMETALETDDYSAVLHSSASIFETLAKDIVGIPSVQDQTLASFFERYKKDSQLPEEILNKILTVYIERNKMPLAGHGSIQTPKITKEEAIILSEQTKSYVRMEYRLQLNKAQITTKEISAS